jgi:hypothetical protein
MGGAYSMYWGIKEIFTGIWLGNMRERVHLEYPGLDGRII